MAKKRQIYLYIALLIPILMVVSTIICVFFYQTPMLPKYDFAYMLVKSDNAYYCGQQFKASLFPSDTVNYMHNKTLNQASNCHDVYFYIYHFPNNESTTLSLDQLKQLKLRSPSSQSQSPDGFSVIDYCYQNNVSGWWPIMNGSSLSPCLKNSDHQKKLNIDYYPTHSNYYHFIFLGWLADLNNAENRKTNK